MTVKIEDTLERDEQGKIIISETNWFYEIGERFRILKFKGERVCEHCLEIDDEICVLYYNGIYPMGHGECVVKHYKEFRCPCCGKNWYEK